MVLDSADPGGTTKSGAGPYAENLASGLLCDENVNRLRQEYANSQPFKYARIETLFQDDLLRRVKDECLSHLSFTEKETDIYRVSAPVYAVSDPDARPLRVLPTVSPPEEVGSRPFCFSHGSMGTHHLYVLDSSPNSTLERWLRPAPLFSFSLLIKLSTIADLRCLWPHAGQPDRRSGFSKLPHQRSGRPPPEPLCPSKHLVL